jgi:hypothetical protein
MSQQGAIFGAVVVVIVALVLVALVAIRRFVLFCLDDLAEATDAELMYLSRSAWTAAIILVIPLGGLAYLYRGRMR